MALDENGYTAPDVIEVVESMSTTARDEFGSLIDVSSDSALGHFIGVTSLEVANIYEDILELYSNLNPNSSEGRMLENLALIGGLIKKGKAYSSGQVTFTGPALTSIPSGTILTVDGESTRRFLTVDTDSISADGTVTIRVRAESSGATAAPTGTLTSFESPIVGVTVTNADDITVGTDEVESDTQFRNRRNNTLTVGGNGTAIAIRAALEQLQGVNAVRVIVNPTMGYLPRGDGIYQRPPNSIECVVEGGNERDIIETITLTKSATSEAFGLLMATYTDFSDNVHQVRFTRPELIDITLDIKYSLYDEEDFPIDGEAKVIQAVLDFADEEYLLGKDVLRDRLHIPCFSVEGLSKVDIYVGKGAALPFSNLSTADIPIELYEKANFSSSNITINQL